MTTDESIKPYESEYVCIYHGNKNGLIQLGVKVFLIHRVSFGIATIHNYVSECNVCTRRFDCMCVDFILAKYVYWCGNVLLLRFWRFVEEKKNNNEKLPISLPFRFACFNGLCYFGSVI